MAVGVQDVPLDTSDDAVTLPRRTRDAWDWAHRNALVLVAVGAVVIQVAIRLWLAWPMSYYQDDWRYGYGALESPLDLAWLLESNNGYFAPLANGLTWVIVRLAPFDYRFAALTVVMLGLLTNWAVYRCLKAYFGAGRLTAVTFVLFALSPLFLVTASWWTVGASVIPAVGLTAVALRHQLAYALSPRSRDLAAAAAAFALALCFTPKAALAVVFAVLLYRVTVRQMHPGASQRTWRSYPAIALLLLAAWSVVYLSLGDNRVVEVDPASLSDVLRESFAGTFLPALMGGPWGAMPAPQPPFAGLPSFAVLVILQVTVLVAAGIHLHRRPRVGVYLPAAVLVTLNLALLTWTASSFFGTSLLRQGRYWADLTLPVLLTAGLAWQWGRRATGPVRSRATVALALLGLLFLQSTAYTAIATAEQMRKASGGRWLERAQASLRAQPLATISNSATPSSLVDPVIFPELAVVSESLRFWATTQAFDEPAAQFSMFDDSGALVPADVDPTTRSVDGPFEGCGYLTTGQTVWIPMQGPPYAWRWGVRVNYLAKRDGTLEIRQGDDRQRLPVRRGATSVYFVTVGSPGAFYARSADPGNAICIDSVVVGEFVPAETIATD